MTRLLPWLYLALLLAETIVLVPLYVWLRPEAGSVLNTVVGTVGLASMIAMLVYSLARRMAWLRSIMRLSTWLHLHIFLGLQGILLVYVHCLPLFWRGGIPNMVNPGMLNLYAVTLVFLSGLFGRYLYAQVPKTLGGQHIAAKQLDEELAALERPVPPEVRSLWEEMPPKLGFFAAASQRRARLATLRGMAVDADLHPVLVQRITLESQKRTLAAAQRVFLLWIVLHRPVALAMYLVSFVHVALGVMFTPALRFW